MSDFDQKKVNFGCNGTVRGLEKATHASLAVRSAENGSFRRD